MSHLLIRTAAILALSALHGCGAQSWAPPAPAGTTWQYDHQGFREHKTNVVAGSFRGPVGLAYGGAFAFRNDSELRGAAETDPFAESTPIDGMRFNEHLAGQGSKLAPGALPAVPALSSGAVAPVPALSSGAVAPAPAPGAAVPAGAQPW